MLDEETVETNEQEVEQDINPDGVQPNEDVSEADKQPANPENISLEEWQKDKRYGKMWKSPNDLYKSYTSLEKMHPELKKNYDTLQNKYNSFSKFLEDNGFKPDTFQEELEKLKNYRNPESEINQIYNYISPYLKNELYSDKVIAFFNELELSELQRKYPGMNAEQIQKMQEQEQRVKHLEQAEQERQQKMYEEQMRGSVEKGFKDCEDVAKNYGFKITPEVRNYLINHCLKNDIDPKYIKSEFFNLYGEQLLSARDKKILNAQQENKTKLKNAQILGGTNNKTPNPPAKLKGAEALKAGWEKVFGKTS